MRRHCSDVTASQTVHRSLLPRPPRRRRGRRGRRGRAGVAGKRSQAGDGGMHACTLPAMAHLSAHGWAEELTAELNGILPQALSHATTHACSESESGTLPHITPRAVGVLRASFSSSTLDRSERVRPQKAEARWPSAIAFSAVAAESLRPHHPPSSCFATATTQRRSGRCVCDLSMSIYRSRSIDLSIYSLSLSLSHTHTTHTHTHTHAHTYTQA